MVGTIHIGMDPRGANLGFQCLTYEEIVDPPTNIACPGIAEIGPPRVMSFTLRKQTKRVHESCIKKSVNPFPLLLCEAMLTLVGVRIREIVRRVGNIEISAEDNRLFLLELLEKGKKCRIPVFVPQRKAGKIGLGVRCVGSNYEEILEFSRY